jgi:hypothetical protein
MNPLFLMMAFFVCIMVFSSEPKPSDCAVWYHSKSCVPCRKMEPDIDVLIADGYDIEKRDSTTNKSVTRIPLTVFFNRVGDGYVETHRVTGYRPRGYLVKYLKRKVK